MPELTKDDCNKISLIANKATDFLNMVFAQPDVIEDLGKITVKKIDIVMDLEFVNDICPLDLDLLIKFNNSNFAHDIFGIWKHFDRATKTLKDGFMPRCAHRSPIAWGRGS